MRTFFRKFLAGSLVLLMHFFSSTAYSIARPQSTKITIERVKGTKLEALLAVANDLRRANLRVSDFDFSIRELPKSFEVYPMRYDPRTQTYFRGNYIYVVSKSTLKVTSKIKESLYDSRSDKIEPVQTRKNGMKPASANND